MSNRWDYRSVEGLLYGLGQPPEARPSRGIVDHSPGTHRSGSRPPAARFLDERVDIGIAVNRTLEQDEAADLRDHYILGIRRHGYKRRSTIIKKLVHTLNSGTENPD